MIHLRRYIFDLIDDGKSDPEIATAVLQMNGISLTPPRVANYRELFFRLDEAGRKEFIDGKRDLMGTRT